MPWTNGMVKRMMRDTWRTCKVILNENRRPLAEWVQLVLVVQGAFNAGYRKRCKACRYKAGFGCEPGTPFAMLAAHEEDH